jgi:hypothetical protein
MAKLSAELQQLVDARVEEAANKMITKALKDQADKVVAKLDEYLASPAFVEKVQQTVVDEVNNGFDDGLYELLSPKQYSAFQKKLAEGVLKTLGIQ